MTLKIPKVKRGKYIAIYDKVAKLSIDGWFLVQVKPKDWQRITSNLRNQAHRGAYGDGVTIKTRSHSFIDPFGKEQKMLRIEKVMK